MLPSAFEAFKNASLRIYIRNYKGGPEVIKPPCFLAQHCLLLSRTKIAAHLKILSLSLGSQKANRQFSETSKRMGKMRVLREMHGGKAGPKEDCGKRGFKLPQDISNPRNARRGRENRQGHMMNGRNWA